MVQQLAEVIYSQVSTTQDSSGGGADKFNWLAPSADQIYKQQWKQIGVLFSLKPCQNQQLQEPSP